MFAEALGDDVVARDLDPLWQARPRGSTASRTGERRSLGQRVERDREPVVGQDGGMNAAGELA